MLRWIILCLPLTVVLGAEFAILNAPNNNETSCDQIIRDEDGEVTSPNHPNDYPPNSRCQTTLIAEEDDVIFLEFVEFLLEGKPGRCVYDKLEIYDGGELIGTYCGEASPGRILSTTNELKLIFTSDESIEYSGYLAEFEHRDKDDPPPPPACGGKFVKDAGTVTSQNYPEKYEPNSNCEYEISLETEGLIQLEFTDFELEFDSSCSNDYVEVRDGTKDGQVLGKFCGTSVYKIRATGKSLYMKFISDNSVEYKGFNATWKKTSCEDVGGNCAAECENGELKFECGAGLKCCVPDLLPKECGQSPVNPAGKYIVGGKDAKPNSWPWQGSLQRGTFHFCGSSLIAKKWAITAAHCVDGRNEVDIVLGEHDRRTTSGNEQRVRADKVIMHEDFVNSSPWPNDIALLKISSGVDINKFVSPGCLPNSENEDFGPEDSCFITGWGNTQGEQDSNILQELRIDPITNEECGRMWGSSLIRDTNICIGRGGTGSCNGDSGGPFSCKKKEGWVVAGATSWGISGCTTPGFPSVYTRISKYVNWIVDKLGKNQ